MESDVVFWLVAAIFYLPFHLLPPLGYIVVMVTPEQRPALVRRAMLVGGIVATLAFVLAIFTWQAQRTLAMLALLLAFLPPWFDTWRSVRRVAPPADAA